MATRVLVMSPLHNLGQTVVSTLYAQGATFHGRTSMLLATEQNTPISSYLGLEDDVKDPTRSVMQIVKLIDSGAIADADILDYAHQYTKNGYYLDMSDKALLGRDRYQITQHLFKRTPCDIVVMDTSYNIDDDEMEELLEVADAVFCVIDMSPKALRYMENWLQSKRLKNFDNIFVVINKYDETVSSMRDYNKRMSIVSSRMLKLHYNPWITKCTLSSTLGTILPLSVGLDYRVANLAVDVGDFTRCCASIDIMKVKKGF